MLAKIQAWLDGKKTYLVIISGICLAVVGYAEHTLSISQMVGAIWAALGAGALRSAIGDGTAPKA